MMLSTSHKGNANQYHYTDITMTTIKIGLIIPRVGEHVGQLKHSRIGAGNKICSGFLKILNVHLPSNSTFFFIEV